MAQVDYFAYSRALSSHTGHIALGIIHVRGLASQRIGHGGRPACRT